MMARLAREGAPLYLAGVRPLFIAGLALAAIASAAPDGSLEFAQSVRPVLAQNCGGCHSPDNPKNREDFLKATSAKDIESKRGLWRSVAAQLRNRTMPPVASKLSEDDRFRIATWVEDRLRQTACNAGDFAGDGTGGEGFDTNGETLYVPPMMMERYMEAAQQALDRVIITPPLHKNFRSAEMEPALPSKMPGRALAPGQEVAASLPIFADGAYNLRVSIERPADIERHMSVKVDGVAAGKLVFQRDPNGAPTNRAQSARLARGV